jgi:hypothetical protein
MNNLKVFAYFIAGLSAGLGVTLALVYVLGLIV